MPIFIDVSKNSNLIYILYLFVNCFANFKFGAKALCFPPNNNATQLKMLMF